MQREERVLAKAVTEGMKDATTALKDGLRQQVLSAGLGSRLANTWRARTFPERKASLHPTGYAWSNAPQVVDYFNRGPEVVPVNGHKYLAIPTREALSGQFRKGRGQRMTVPEVERKLGQRLTIIKGRAGHLLGLYDASLGRGGKRRKGLKRNLVLLFTFVPAVKGVKRFDVASLVNTIGATVPDKIRARIG